MPRMMTVFNFHGVGPLLRETAPGERSCWLDTDHFEAILDRIQGWENVRITFDDGNQSDYEIVLPALLKRGLHAVFFICSGRVGKSTFLNATELQELCAKGMTIGSHGIHHQPWRTLDLTDLWKEVAVSRKVLEDLSGEPVETAACPFGSYDHRVLRNLKKAGYRTVFTSDGGTCEEAEWLMARITIKRSFSLGVIDGLLSHPPGSVRRFLNRARISLKSMRPSPR